jgi:Asp-tRNA(Asn)/Glu-tRNA(Gln) amidotransferase A subunit family amidase
LTAQDFHIEETTVRQIAEALKEKKTTCRTIAKEYIHRIEAYDRKGPSLKTVILVNPKALEEAEKLDSIFREKGPTGPLHGIPVLLKDNVETAGMVTTSGSLTLEDYVPDDDAFLTKKLKKAGALILAKANMHEFAVWGESVSSILGQVLNPYDLTRTPGGSSGGTGAGIAANFAAVGIGTDTINSIRSPSSACSCVGIRPTVGLVSRNGISPYSFDQDTAGPICRTVEDAVSVLDTIVGYDPADPETAWSIGNVSSSYTGFLRLDGLEGKRIGVLRSLFGNKPEHKDVNAAMKRSLDAMEQGGAVLVEVLDLIDTSYLVSKVSVHLHTLKDDLESYLEALGAKTRYHTLDGLIASGKIHPSIVENMKTAAGLSKDDDEYRIRTLKRLALRTQLVKLMADLELDALVYPHQKRLVVPIGESQVERNGVLASAAGFPAITLPGGFSPPTETAPDGVPIGLEILGRPWSEGVIISMAYAFEQRTLFRTPPFSTPPLN